MALPSSFQEFIRADARFSQDCAQRSFGHIAWVMGESDLAAGRGMSPDFVATRAGTVEDESTSAEFAGYLAILESRQAAH